MNCSHEFQLFCAVNQCLKCGYRGEVCRDYACNGDNCVVCGCCICFHEGEEE